MLVGTSQQGIIFLTSGNPSLNNLIAAILGDVRDMRAFPDPRYREAMATRINSCKYPAASSVLDALTTGKVPDVMIFLEEPFLMESFNVSNVVMAIQNMNVVYLAAFGEGHTLATAFSEMKASDLLNRWRDEATETFTPLLSAYELPHAVAVTMRQRFNAGLRNWQSRVLGIATDYFYTRLRAPPAAATPESLARDEVTGAFRVAIPADRQLPNLHECLSAVRLDMSEAMVARLRPQGAVTPGPSAPPDSGTGGSFAAAPGPAPSPASPLRPIHATLASALINSPLPKWLSGMLGSGSITEALLDNALFGLLRTGALEVERTGVAHPFLDDDLKRVSWGPEVLAPVPHFIAAGIPFSYTDPTPSDILTYLAAAFPNEEPGDLDKAASALGTALLGAAPIACRTLEPPSPTVGQRVGELHRFLRTSVSLYGGPTTAAEVVKTACLAGQPSYSGQCGQPSGHPRSYPGAAGPWSGTAGCVPELVGWESRQSFALPLPTVRGVTFLGSALSTHLCCWGSPLQHGRV